MSLTPKETSYVPVANVDQSCQSSQSCYHTFPFLKLPSELRCMVYEYVFTSPHEIRVEDQVIDTDRPVLKWPMIPRDQSWVITFRTDESSTIKPSLVVEHSDRNILLRLCRYVRYEALPCFYRYNTFVFDSPDILSDFILAIGDGIKHLSSLKIEKFDYAVWEIDASVIAKVILAQRSPKLTLAIVFGGETRLDTLINTHFDALMDSHLDQDTPLATLATLTGVSTRTLALRSRHDQRENGPLTAVMKFEAIRHWSETSDGVHGGTRSTTYGIIVEVGTREALVHTVIRAECQKFLKKVAKVMAMPRDGQEKKPHNRAQDVKREILPQRVWEAYCGNWLAY